MRVPSSRSAGDSIMLCSGGNGHSLAGMARKIFDHIHWGRAVPDVLPADLVEICGPGQPIPKDSIGNFGNNIASGLLFIDAYRLATAREYGRRIVESRQCL